MLVSNNAAMKYITVSLEAEARSCQLCAGTVCLRGGGALLTDVMALSQGCTSLEVTSSRRDRRWSHALDLVPCQRR